MKKIVLKILSVSLLSCSHRDANDVDAAINAIGDPLGQIAGQYQGSRVCIHKFSYDEQKYVVSDPSGNNCGNNKRSVPKDQVTFSSNAFGKWLVEVPATGMIKLDMRYASNNIFPKGNGSFRIPKPLYGQGRCFLHPKAREQLDVADKRLREKHPNLRLLMLDCYRPQYVSKQMWEVVRDPIFVAASGKSGHNQGGSVDLTLATLGAGNVPVPLDMGSPFDLFDKDKVAYPGLGISDAQKNNRKILREAMLAANWKPYNEEWWHFSTTDKWDQYLDLPL